MSDQYLIDADLRGPFVATYSNFNSSIDKQKHASKVWDKISLN